MSRGMKFYTAAALALVIVFSQTGSPLETVPEWPEVVSPEHGFRTPGALFQDVRRHVKHASADALDGVRFDGDDSLAIAAAWEYVRRNFKQPHIPATARLNEKAVMRFLGFIEARLRMPIPVEWEKSVLSAECVNGGLLRLLPSDSEDNGTQLKARPMLAGGVWKASIAGREVGVPASVIGNASIGSSTWIKGKGATYFSFHQMYPPHRCLLHALRKEESIPDWSAEIWCTLGWTSYSSLQGRYRMWICTADKRVAVFGVSESLFHIEVFDMQTGENIIRFISECLDD